MQVNIHEAKTHFSKLIQKTLEGEEVIIARGGNPIVSIVPYAKKKLLPRKGGQLKGLLTIREDFDAPLPDDLLKQFYEGE